MNQSNPSTPYYPAQPANNYYPPAGYQSPVPREPSSYKVEIERQTCGYVLAILALAGHLIHGISYIRLLFDWINREYKDYFFISILSVNIVSEFLFVYFFRSIVDDREYLAGKPEPKRFTGLFISAILELGIVIAFCVKVDWIIGLFIGSFNIFKMIYAIVCYFIYSQDDASGSCLLCLKPYNEVNVPKYSYQAQQQQYQPAGYPQQQYQPSGYPQQQYQAAGYPQQQYQAAGYPQQPASPYHQGQPASPYGQAYPQSPAQISPDMSPKSDV